MFAIFVLKRDFNLSLEQMVSKVGTHTLELVTAICWGWKEILEISLIFILQNEEIKLYAVYSMVEAAAFPFSTLQIIAGWRQHAGLLKDPGGWAWGSYPLPLSDGAARGAGMWAQVDCLVFN